ncbi:MAG: peptide-binding protein [Acidobacteria bacterium]|nr:peptide-binding protein [Acidobacteriota bacterium]
MTRGAPRPPAVAALVAALVLAAACGGPAPAPAGPPVRWYLPTDPRTLDSARATETSSFVIAGMLGDPLLDVDARLEFVPRVAESWDWSDDHRVLTFHLRDGVRWHDGRPVTAADVVHTWKVLSDPARSSPDRSAAFNLVESVEAPDPRTARVVYSRPFAPALVAWAQPLLPAHVADRAAHPVGCGPWTFERWDRGERVLLRANADYWDGPPAAPAFDFEILGDYATRLAALESGSLDGAPLMPDQWERVRDDAAFAGRFTTLEYEMLFFWYIAWNGDGSNAFFADPRVRRAMTLAIDRQAYVERVTRGAARVAVTSFHPGHWCYDPDLAPWPYDPARARELLAQAGWSDRDGDGVVERDGRPFRFELLFSQPPADNARAAAFVQDSLGRVGIAVVLRAAEWAVFQDRARDRDFQALMSGRYLGVDPDPYELWHSSQAAPGGANYAGLRDPELDGWIERARETFDRGERLRLYRLVQARLHELQPDTFFFYPVSRLAVSRQLTGVRPSPLGAILFWPGTRTWRREP